MRGEIGAYFLKAFFLHRNKNRPYNPTFRSRHKKEVIYSFNYIFNRLSDNSM